MKDAFKLLALILTHMSAASKVENQLYCIASKAHNKARVANQLN